MTVRTGDHPLIAIDPQIMAGKPCIKGTRISVHHVLQHLGDGMTPEAYLREFPSVTAEGIRAAQAWAAAYFAEEDVVYG
ncbi:MAG: DUF433 domain-containing protein [Parvularcula sp.]|nr:DUF433 domain-containing protein [Parvularcula sp.]